MYTDQQKTKLVKNYMCQSLETKHNGISIIMQLGTLTIYGLLNSDLF